MCRYEMNEYQKSIMNIEKTYPLTAVCNVGGIMEFLPGTDTALLSRAADIFIRQNPVIRFRIDRNEKLYIGEGAPNIQMCSYPDVHDTDKFINALIGEPFELYDSPLYSFMYIKTADSEFGFMKIHHILGDHMALLEMFSQLEKIYLSLKNGTEPEEKRDMRYIDTLMKSPVDAPLEAKKHYKERFEKFGVHPLDKRMRSLEAGLYEYHMKQDDALGLLEFCKENKIKPEAAFYAALAIYEKKTRGSVNSIFGRVLMNRGRGQLDVFGLYANTTPVFISGKGDFLSVCRGAYEELNENTLFASYPLTSILSDNGIRERCFDVEVSFVSMGMMPLLKIAEAKKYYNGCIELPMRIHIMRQKREIVLNIEYAKEMFSPEYIKAFTESIINIILCGIKGEEAEPLTDEDKKAYLDLNAVHYAKEGTTVSRLFSAYASLHKDETALIYNEKHFTFSKIEQMANCIAAYCAGKKVIGLMTGRCEYLLPAMLGAIRAGCAYMPLNPALEPASECDMILSLSKYDIPGALMLDEITYTDAREEDLSTPSGAAYYMRTSGSTGEPKTVMISNGSLYLRLKWMHEKYSLNRRILQKTVSTFDVSGWELLCPIFGGCSVMMKDGEEKDLTAIVKYIEKYEIESVHFVPSMLRLFLRYIKKGSLATLKNVFSSGEALDAPAVRLFYDKLPRAKLCNLYGPTECTIDVTSYDCTGEEDEIPIGKPVYNTGVFIIRPDGGIAPRGVEGEILITGDLVGMGYTHGGGYTVFNGASAYPTGDMGVLGFDGNIYYRGRRDSQVKVNGKRVDLSEIEGLIKEIDTVTNCAAIYDNGIIAYYSAEAPIEDIAAHLAKKTDRLPSRIVYLDKMPCTSSGKIDRAALCKIDVRRKIEPPANETEEALLSEALKVINRGSVKVDIGVNDNLLDAGLDSLALLTLSLNLKEKGFDLTTSDIYLNPTIRQLAARENTPKMLVRLNGIQSGSVLCCFPYAGGAPQAFSRIAQESKCSVFGVNYDFFHDDSAIGEIAMAVSEELKKYKKIYLAASCIGSAFALETAAALENGGKKVEEVYIAASLPARTPKGINPWRMLSEKSTEDILSKSVGQSLPKGFSKKSFLRDTDRYFKYMAKEKRVISAKAYIAFAKDDAFTKGYKKKAEKWKKYFANDITFSYFKSSDHYFFTQTGNILTLMRGGDQSE